MHANNVIQFSQEARKRRGGMPLLPKPPIDLDNSRRNEADMSEGANDMSKSNRKFRQRAQIGDQTVWLCGDTRQELLDQYLQLSIKAGIVVTRPVRRHRLQPARRPRFARSSTIRISRRLWRGLRPRRWKTTASISR